MDGCTVVLSCSGVVNVTVKKARGSRDVSVVWLHLHIICYCLCYGLLLPSTTTGLAAFTRQRWRQFLVGRVALFSGCLAVSITRRWSLSTVHSRQQCILSNKSALQTIKNALPTHDETALQTAKSAKHTFSVNRGLAEYWNGSLTNRFRVVQETSERRFEQKANRCHHAMLRCAAT